MLRPPLRLAAALACTSVGCGSSQTRHDETPQHTETTREAPPSNSASSDATAANSTTSNSPSTPPSTGATPGAAAPCPGAVAAGTRDVLREAAPPDVGAI